VKKYNKLSLEGAFKHDLVHCHPIIRCVFGKEDVEVLEWP